MQFCNKPANREVANRKRWSRAAWGPQENEKLHLSSLLTGKRSKALVLLFIFLHYWACCQSWPSQLDPIRSSSVSGKGKMPSASLEPHFPPCSLATGQADSCDVVRMDRPGRGRSIQTDPIGAGSLLGGSGKWRAREEASLHFLHHQACCWLRWDPDGSDITWSTHPDPIRVGSICGSRGKWRDFS